MKYLFTFLLSLLGLISTAQFSYIDLTIGFDQYPQETAWIITLGPDTVLSEDDYGYTNYVNNTITERLLMEASPFPYKFIMTDEFGDGICCEYGSGFFSAENQCQGIIFEDYNFGTDIVEYEFTLIPCELPTVDVTFQVDLNEAPEEIINPEVNGTFNGWCGNCNQMEDPDGDGVWEVVIPISAGSYLWKFSSNNFEFQELPDGVNESGCFVFDEFGFINRQITVEDEDIVLPPVCWESCLPCGAIPGCTDPEAYNWNPWANFDVGFCNLPIDIECESGESPIIVTITPDSYPTETAWELYDQTNQQIIYEVFAGEYDTPSIPVQTAVCAPIGASLQFQITDTYGDGLNAAQFGGIDGTCIVTSCDSTYYFTNPMNVDFGYEDETSFEVLACGGNTDTEGCTDPNYIEYSPTAIIDNGSCSTLVVEGCMDSTQYNYNPDANVEEVLIACNFTLTITDGVGDGWFGSWIGVYQEGWISPQYEMNPEDGFEKTFSIPLNSLDEAQVYFFTNLQSANTIQQCGFKITNPEGEIAIEIPQFFVNSFPFVYEFQPYCGNTCIPFIYGCMDDNAFNYISTANTDDGSCYYTPGCTSAGYLEYYTQGFEADYNDGSCQTLVIFGCTNPDAFNFDSTANVDNEGCIPKVFGCINPLAFNYNESANTEDGSCIAIEEGCTDPTAFNYDEEANVNDESCIEVVFGCIDPTSLNFDPLANTDNETCIPIVLGCTDLTALNYNIEANIEDGSCIDAIYGCTDSTAFNYNELANINNGTCIELIEGCTNPSALNYNINANVDDLSCVLPIYGCTDSTALNYNELANTDNGTCIEIVEGCTDPLALNYNDLANVDDFSCILPIYGCTDSLAFNYNELANVDNGSCEDVITGCTDPSAFNYNPEANTEDFSCIDVIYGCIDPNAVNYNSEANTDNGSCESVVNGCTSGVIDYYNSLNNINSGCFAWVIDVSPNCCNSVWNSGCQDLYNYCEENNEVVGIEGYGNTQIIIYPNPTRDIINIISALQINAVLYNFMGQVVFEGNNVKYIDMSKFSAGIYTLIITYNDLKFTKKIVKQ